MRIAWLLFLAMTAVSSIDSSGQISAAPSVYQPADREAEDALAAPGVPKNPPIFTKMTTVAESTLQYEDTVEFKGHVTSVERDNEEQLVQYPNPVRTKETLEFDDSGHLIKRINEVSNCVTTEILTWDGKRPKKQRSIHHCDHSKLPARSDFKKWTYNDKDGRVSEFQSGSDQIPNVDFVNIRYDTKGRLLGYEGFARYIVQFSYVGSRITQSIFPKGQEKKIYEQVQTVDAKGRVIDLKVSDMSGGTMTPRFHVAFKYDEKGRVIEQQTAPFKSSSDDYSPLPGKLTVEYDDEKQSGEQKFYDTDGKLALHTKFEYDRDGVMTKLRLLDSSGNERVGGETFVDAQHKSTTRPGATEWEVVYDDHGNWTERRRWFTPADGGPRIMTRLIRQTITYR